MTQKNHRHSYSAKAVCRQDVPRKDGTCPVIIRVILNRVPVTSNLKIHVPPPAWNDDRCRVVAYRDGAITRKSANDFNLIIGRALSRANEIFMEARLLDVPLTKSAFVNKFNNPVHHFSFFDFVYEQIDILRGVHDKHTITKYLSTTKKLKKFAPNLSFGDLTFDTIQRYDQFLRQKEGLAQNTIWSHHKDLRKFINLAIKKELPIKNPYALFKLKKHPGKKVFLTQAEVNKLLSMYSRQEFNDRLHRVLRYFLFSCFTGLRISDVQRITHENIVHGTLVVTPHKTRSAMKMIKIPLNSISEKLIQHRNGKLFDTVSDQKTNDFLKEIAHYAGIEKHITFHVARHTFATIHYMVNRDLLTLRDLLGHSKVETTEIYAHLVNGMKSKTVDNMAALFQ